MANSISVYPEQIRGDCSHKSKSVHLHKQFILHRSINYQKKKLELLQVPRHGLKPIIPPFYFEQHLDKNNILIPQGFAFIPATSLAPSPKKAHPLTNRRNLSLCTILKLSINNIKLAYTLNIPPKILKI